MNAKVVFLKRVGEGIMVYERDPWEIFEEGVAELSADSFAWTRKQPPLDVLEKDPWELFEEAVAELTPESFSWEREQLPAQEWDWQP